MLLFTIKLKRAHLLLFISPQRESKYSTKWRQSEDTRKVSTLQLDQEIVESCFWSTGVWSNLQVKKGDGGQIQDYK